MFRSFEAKDADGLWQDIAMAFRNGKGSQQASRNGQMQEILHAALCLHDPRQRWVVSRQPALNPAFALAEVVWIVAGRQDSAFLNYFNRELPKYAGNGPTYHGAYGFRLRQRFGFDQLRRAYDVLRQDRDSRQVVLQIWDATIDLPDDGAEPRSRDIPCNVMSLLKVRSGRLEWTQIMRSNDIFRGLPYNIVQFTCLQEIMAGWLGVGLGPYHQISDSLHLYEENVASIGGASSTGAVLNADDLMLDRVKSDAVFLEVASRIEQVIDSSVSALDVARIADWPDGPRAYRNIMSVVCAEGARRRKSPEVAAQIAATCTNPVLTALWTNWCDRMSPHRHSENGDVTLSQEFNR